MLNFVPHTAQKGTSAGAHGGGSQPLTTALCALQPAYSLRRRLLFGAEYRGPARPCLLQHPYTILHVAGSVLSPQSSILGSRYGLPRVRWRSASNSTTLPATAALSDSARPSIGMAIRFVA